MVCTKSLINSRKSYFLDTISIFPASIMEKSKISLIIPNKSTLASRMLSEYRTVWGSLVSDKIMSFMPKTASIGARSSLEMVDKNAVLALLAATTLLETSIRASRCCLSSEISSKIQRKVATFPAGVCWQRTTRARSHLPSLVKKVVVAATRYSKRTPKMEKSTNSFICNLKCSSTSLFT